MSVMIHMKYAPRAIGLINSWDDKDCEEILKNAKNQRSSSDSGIGSSDSSGNDSSSNPSSSRSETPDSSVGSPIATKTVSKASEIAVEHRNTTHFELDLAVDSLDKEQCCDCTYLDHGECIQATTSQEAQEAIVSNESVKKEELYVGIPNKSTHRNRLNCLLKLTRTELSLKCHQTWLRFKKTKNCRLKSRAKLMKISDEEQQNDENDKESRDPIIQYIRDLLVEDEWKDMPLNVWQYLHDISGKYFQKSNEAEGKMYCVPKELFSEIVQYSMIWHDHYEKGLTAPPPSCSSISDIPECVIKFFLALIYLKYAVPTNENEPID
uniref:MRG domain-containing protein n=2 Tax=Caenorhabditis tropicalis TaxID=1561998 RepID=A0A1I7T849_9PELO